MFFLTAVVGLPVEGAIKPSWNGSAASASYTFPVSQHLLEAALTTTTLSFFRHFSSTFTRVLGSGAAA